MVQGNFKTGDVWGEPVDGKVPSWLTKKKQLENRSSRADYASIIAFSAVARGLSEQQRFVEVQRKRKDRQQVREALEPKLQMP